MDLTKDPLFDPAHPELAPCRWIANIRGCDGTDMFATCAGVTIIFALCGVCYTGYSFAQLRAHPFARWRFWMWSPARLYIFQFALAQMALIYEAANLLIDPTTTYAYRTFVHIFPFVFCLTATEFYSAKMIQAFKFADSSSPEGHVRTGVRWAVRLSLPCLVVAVVTFILSGHAIDNRDPNLYSILSTTAYISISIILVLKAAVYYIFGMRFCTFLSSQLDVTTAAITIHMPHNGDEPSRPAARASLRRAPWDQMWGINLMGVASFLVGAVILIFMATMQNSIIGNVISNKVFYIAVQFSFSPTLSCLTYLFLYYEKRIEGGNASAFSSDLGNLERNGPPRLMGSQYQMEEAKTRSIDLAAYPASLPHDHFTPGVSIHNDHLIR